MSIFNNKKLYFIDKSGKSDAIFLRNKCSFIDINNLQHLIKYSRQNNYKDVRVCMHNNKKSIIQNMINLTFKSKKKINFHKHLKKDEAYHLIKGKMMIEYFCEKKIKKVMLGKEKFLFRIGKNIYHRIKPLSNYIIYHEIRTGPFLKNDSIFLK